MDKLGVGMQWMLGDSAYRSYMLSTSTTRALLWLERKMNCCVARGREGRDGRGGRGGEGRGGEGRGGEGRGGEGMGGRREGGINMGTV